MNKLDQFSRQAFRSLLQEKYKLWKKNKPAKYNASHEGLAQAINDEIKRNGNNYCISKNAVDSWFKSKFSVPDDCFEELCSVLGITDSELTNLNLKSNEEHRESFYEYLEGRTSELSDLIEPIEEIEKYIDPYLNDLDRIQWWYLPPTQYQFFTKNFAKRIASVYKSTLLDGFERAYKQTIFRMIDCIRTFTPKFYKSGEKIQWDEDFNYLEGIKYPLGEDSYNTEQETTAAFRTLVDCNFEYIPLKAIDTILTVYAEDPYSNMAIEKNDLMYLFIEAMDCTSINSTEYLYEYGNWESKEIIEHITVIANFVTEILSKFFDPIKVKSCEKWYTKQITTFANSYDFEKFKTLHQVYEGENHGNN